MFYKIGVYKNFAKFTGKHLCWSLCNLILKETPAEVFSCVFCEVFQNNSKRLLLTFRCNSPIKKNLSDVSTIGCLLFLGYYPNKRLQLSLRYEFTLRLQFPFKYLKSQNERVLSQIFSTKPHKNFIHFFYQDALELRQPIFSRIPYRERLLQWNFVYIKCKSSRRWIIC